MKTPRRPRLAVEALETRDLMATYALSGTTLSIYGGTGNDVIDVGMMSGEGLPICNPCMDKAVAGLLEKLNEQT